MHKSDQVEHSSGPFLAAALICERVLQEADGTLSAIRIIDQITFESEPETATADSLSLLIGLKGGEPGESHQVRVLVRAPDGVVEELGQHLLEFGSVEPNGIPGANLVLQLTIGLRSRGDYWFDLEVDGQRLTAMPLRVVHASSARSVAETSRPF